MNIEAYEVPTTSFVPCSRITKQGVVAAIFPLVLLTAGTGGVMTARSAGELSSWVHNPTIHVARSLSRRIDTRSPAEHVALIRDTFGLNMSDLACVLGVTRPTVYAWLAGQEPKPETLTHIRRISRTAEEVKGLKIPRVENLIHRPILGGYSLLDKLKANEDPLAYLGMFKTFADKELHSRRAQKGSGKHKSSFDEVASNYSTPTHDRS